MVLAATSRRAAWRARLARLALTELAGGLFGLRAYSRAVRGVRRDQSTFAKRDATPASPLPRRGRRRRRADRRNRRQRHYRRPDPAPASAAAPLPAPAPPPHVRRSRKTRKPARQKRKPRRVKIQLEQLDLLAPWPTTLAAQGSYYARSACSSARRDADRRRLHASRPRPGHHPRSPATPHRGGVRGGSVKPSAATKSATWTRFSIRTAPSGCANAALAKSNPHPLHRRSRK
mgnify:CR=1 FL=1